MTGNEALKAALIAYSEEYFSQYDFPPTKSLTVFPLRTVSEK